MTCSNCGSLNEEGVDVCVQCGAGLTKVPVATEVLTPTLQSEPTFTANGSAVGQSTPPMPGHLKAIGYGNLVAGPLLAIINLIVVAGSISELRAAGEPEALSVGLEINVALFVLFGLLLAVSGAGLLRQRKWGRTLSLISAGFSFFVLFAAVIITNVLKNLYEAGSLGRPVAGTAYHQVQVVSAVPALAPLYGIILIVLLMLPAARAWARGKGLAAAGSSGQFATGGTAVTARPTSGLAIASLICSALPFMLLTQIAGLVLGITALVKIRKSRGALGGKGFAIAGVTISSLIFLFIGGILSVVWLTGGFN
jgi:hypothetical protein